MIRQAIASTCLFVFLGVQLISPALAAQTVDLMYRFEPGQTFHKTNIKIKDIWNNTTNTDPSSAFNELSVYRRVFKVLSVDSQGTATLQMTMNLLETGDVLPDDSVKKHLVPANDPIASLMQHPTTLKIDKKGRLLSVDGIGDKELDALYGNIKSATPQTRRLIDMYVSVLFSEESVRQTLPRFIFPEYPQHPVAVGESWSRTEALDLENVKMENTLKFTLKSLDATDATTNQCQIALEETMNNLTTTDPTMLAETSMYYSKGLYTINTQTGLPESFHLDTHYKLDLYRKKPDGGKVQISSQMASINSITDGREPRFPEWVDEVLALDALDIEMLLNMAMTASVEFQHERAEKILLAAWKKPIKEIPLNMQVELKVLTGSNYVFLKRNDDAIRTFQEIINLLHNPDLTMGDYEKKSVFHDSNFMLANLYHGQKRYEKADALYKDVLAYQRVDHNPKLSHTLINYAYLKKDMKDDTEAGYLLREGIELFEKEVIYLEQAFGKESPNAKAGRKRLTELYTLSKTLPNPNP